MVLRGLDVHDVHRLSDRDDYEWVRATAELAFDPTDPGNERIVDLDLARRDGNGLVAAASDVRILRPARGGNGRLLCVVPNRGLLGTVPFSGASHATVDFSEPAGHR